MRDVPLSEVWTSAAFTDEDRRKIEEMIQQGYAVRIQRIVDEPTTREGELCWVKVSTMSFANCRKFTRGRLLKWAQDFTEFESGPGSFPVAVVELIDTGEVQKVGVQAISFAADCPGELFTMKKGG